MKRSKVWRLAAAVMLVVAGATLHVVRASDHDDGETDMKARALNLTDHYAFLAPDDSGKLTLIMNFNPRALPGFPYYASTDARYEFHVSRAAGKTSVPTASSDVLLRFEMGAPDADGVQAVTFTVLVDGEVVGTHSGASTSYADSKMGNVTTNSATIDGQEYDYFVGMRTDSFYFDVIRFFQVRAFLADRFFGGSGGNGNADASLSNNCKDQGFLAGVLGVTELDGDDVNLFNPPECAPDFTKNYNVTSITVNVPIAALQADGETVFDTWSTISVAQ